MKKSILLLFLFFSFVVNSQGNKPGDSFSNLEQIIIDRDYNVKLFTTKDIKKIEEKSLEDKESIEDEHFATLYKVNIESNQTNEIIVGYTNAPSGDPTFQFYKKNKNNKLEYLFSFYCLQIYIPGNGFIYTSGHTNNLFDQKRKFKFSNDTIKEVEQPFYSVGFKTKTLKSIKIYGDLKFSSILATIPENSNIEIVAAEYQKETTIFLIKTSFGLIGWWKLDNNPSNEIKDLFYKGD